MSSEEHTKRERCMVKYQRKRIKYQIWGDKVKYVQLNTVPSMISLMTRSESPSFLYCSELPPCLATALNFRRKAPTLNWLHEQRRLHMSAPPEMKAEELGKTPTEAITHFLPRFPSKLPIGDSELMGGGASDYIREKSLYFCKL